MKEWFFTQILPPVGAPLVLKNASLMFEHFYSPSHVKNLLHVHTTTHGVVRNPPGPSGDWGPPDAGLTGNKEGKKSPWEGGGWVRSPPHLSSSPLIWLNQQPWHFASGSREGRRCSQPVLMSCQRWVIQKPDNVGVVWSSHPLPPQLYSLHSPPGSQRPITCWLSNVGCWRDTWRLLASPDFQIISHDMLFSVFCCLYMHLSAEIIEFFLLLSQDLELLVALSQEEDNLCEYQRSFN